VSIAFCAYFAGVLIQTEPVFYLYSSDF